MNIRKYIRYFWNRNALTNPYKGNKEKQIRILHNLPHISPFRYIEIKIRISDEYLFYLYLILMYYVLMHTQKMKCTFLLEVKTLQKMKDYISSGIKIYFCYGLKKKSLEYKYILSKTSLTNWDWRILYLIFWINTIKCSKIHNNY